MSSVFLYRVCMSRLYTILCFYDNTLDIRECILVFLFSSLCIFVVVLVCVYLCKCCCLYVCVCLFV